MGRQCATAAVPPDPACRKWGSNSKSGFAKSATALYGQKSESHNILPGNEEECGGNINPTFLPVFNSVEIWQV